MKTKQKMLIKIFAIGFQISMIVKSIFKKRRIDKQKKITANVKLLFIFVFNFF